MKPIIKKLMEASESFAVEKPTISQVLHSSLLETHGEALNEISNLKHDYAIVSAQRNHLLTALKDLVEQLHIYINADDADLPDTSQAETVIASAEGGRAE